MTIEIQILKGKIAYLEDLIKGQLEEIRNLEEEIDTLQESVEINYNEPFKVLVKKSYGSLEKELGFDTDKRMFFIASSKTLANNFYYTHLYGDDEDRHHVIVDYYMTYDEAIIQL